MPHLSGPDCLPLSTNSELPLGLGPDCPPILANSELPLVLRPGQLNPIAHEIAHQALETYFGREVLAYSAESTLGGLVVRATIVMENGLAPAEVIIDENNRPFFEYVIFVLGALGEDTARRKHQLEYKQTVLSAIGRDEAQRQLQRKRQRHQNQNQNSLAA